MSDAEVGGVARAIIDVCSAVVAEEEGEPPPVQRVSLPVLDRALPIAGLAEHAGIDAVATDVLRLLVAAELDRRAHRCMRRLAQDPTLPGIEVDAVVTAAEGVGIAPALALEALDPEGRLVGRGLIEWTERATGPLLTRRLTVAQAVLRLARGGSPTPSEQLLATTKLAIPLEELALADATAVVGGEPQHRYAKLIVEASSGRPPWIVGPAAVGKRSLVASLAARERLSVRCIDYRYIAARPLDALVPALWREALIHGAMLVIHDCDASVDAARSPSALYSAVARAGVPAVFTSAETPRLADFDTPPLVLELALPPPERRAVLWQSALGVTDEQRELVQLGWQLPLAPGRVIRAASVAHELAAIRGTPLTANDVREAVSQQVAQKVATLGKRIRDSQTWDDVVLPPETTDSIKELIARVRLRKQVLEDWGFQRKLAKGIGLAAMFLGPPGTGKTMVAGIVAKELGLELYQIDMSRIASKWIGETEKNLAAIFDAAEGANVLLLFDECDSLFAKRSEVKSSNDRHANAEVNYLLQRIERFEGVAILTTNLESSIDPAFKRRLAFRIHFSVPDVKERETLWRRMMPKEAKTASIDYGAFARDYELAGGNIRNAVLRAAFLAAADDSPITESHLERSIVLEYRDAGKLSPGGRLS